MEKRKYEIENSVWGEETLQATVAASRTAGSQSMLSQSMLSQSTL